jgi:hypothetical protein
MDVQKYKKQRLNLSIEKEGGGDYELARIGLLKKRKRDTKRSFCFPVE